MDDPKLVLPVALTRAFTKAQGTVLSTAPQVDYLKQLCTVCPPIQTATDELALMHEHLDALVTVGLNGIALGDQPSERG